MERTDLVAQAVRLALVAGMVGVVSISPAYAQDERDELAIQEKITVTGSRIKRADAEGPLPVTVISREDIEQSGEISVSELLRTQTFNTFGSSKQMSGSENIGGSVNTINMRGLGSQYTLVLVDGRRMASAPNFSSAVQNLSVIPLAAVERIEVLRDGASAIYGTDALAGVVNIILRKDYSGIHLAYDIGRPEQSGGDEDSYSITGGVSGAKGNITFGMDAQKQDIVYGRDRDFTSVGLSQFGFPGSYFAYLTTDDPRNISRFLRPARPGTGEVNDTDTDGDGILDAGLFATFVSVGTFPDPRCPDELGSDPEFPWSMELQGEWDGVKCRYAWWGEGALEAGNDTKSFFVNANYELTERTEFFTRGLFSYNEVNGRYAPSPMWQLGMSQDTVNNPTNPANPTNSEGDAFGGQSVDVDTDGDGVPDATIQGPFDLSLFYRNVPGGNRDTDWDDTLIDYVAGVRGSVDWLGGADWELAAQWSEQTSDETGSGEALFPFMQAAIDDGSFDMFAVSRPYGQDDIAAAQAANATRSGDSRHRITGGDGLITFDTFQLKNGPVPLALGFEYRDENFKRGFDEQTASGAFGGDTADVQDISGSRVVQSLFAETALPLIPQLELTLAGRYDNYNDFGTTVNPKVSVAFRPLDSLLLRGSYGTGFRAPEMEVLYEPSFTGVDYFIDSWRCSQTLEDTDKDGRPNVPEEELPPFHPCLVLEYDQIWNGGNPDLQPEKSDNWTAGFVWSPSADTSLIVDYYNIKIEDQIGDSNGQRLLDEELRLRQAGATGPRVGSVVRNIPGRIQAVYEPYTNTDRVETDGLDIDASYSFSVGRVGDFSTRLLWTHVLNYKDSNEEYFSNLAGEIGFPRDRGQLTINWALGDYSATIVGNYVSDQKTDQYWWDGSEAHIASFTTWDVQASYSTPWNGQITIGARNVLNRDPPFDPRQGIGYDMTQHEIYGRVPYLRIEQDF